MNWHDKIAGTEVLPEDWEGGIVEVDGRWFEVQDVGHADRLLSIGWGESVRWADCRPVFPKKAWAGKTDAELWREVFGASGFAVLLRYDWDWGGRQHYREVRVNQSGGIMEMAPGDMGAEYGSLNTFSWLDADNLARVILALQNAQVLAKRLQEAQP